MTVAPVEMLSIFRNVRPELPAPVLQAIRTISAFGESVSRMRDNAPPASLSAVLSMSWPDRRRAPEVPWDRMTMRSTGAVRISANDAIASKASPVRGRRLMIVPRVTPDRMCSESDTS